MIHEGIPKGEDSATQSASKSLLVDFPILTTGKWEKLGGVECYVATPAVEYPKDKAVLFLSDIFGAHFINAQVSLSPAVPLRLKSDGISQCTS